MTFSNPLKRCNHWQTVQKGKRTISGSLRTHLAHPLFQSDAMQCNRHTDLRRTWTLRRQLIRESQFEWVKYFFSLDSFRKDNIDKMKHYFFFLRISLLRIKSVHWFGFDIKVTMRWWLSLEVHVGVSFCLPLCWQSAAESATAWWQRHRFVTENRPVKDWAPSNQPQGRISYCSILIHVHINNCRWHC